LLGQPHDILLFHRNFLLELREDSLITPICRTPIPKTDEAPVAIFSPAIGALRLTVSGIETDA
ncbi:MAG: hypothetical protein ABGZ53_13075, partial [Fuerstiella sp.]